MALRLGLLRVSFGELLDPGHHAGRRHPEQLGGAVHREAAQVEQHRRDLDPQRHPARRGVGEVQPAGLAAVALLALHEAVLDVLLGPATLAPQPHRPAPPAVPPPTDIGDLRCLKTLRSSSMLYQPWEVLTDAPLSALRTEPVRQELPRPVLPRAISQYLWAR